MDEGARRRRRLVQRLRDNEDLTDPRWAAAFAAVPREVFVPRFFVQHRERWTAVARGDENWLVLATSTDVLVTQLDGDSSRWEVARAAGPVRGTPTCSSSMPGIMAVMLEELLVEDGHRVLEIGTGTGYNAALLCHRLGSANVSTVDVDAELAREAADRLAECGFTPAGAISDGAQGFPERAPFDRMLCTCSVSHIPPAWLEQTVPGGLIVTTLNRPIGAGLVRIVVDAGATGEGEVLARDGRFMPMRAHRVDQPDIAPASPGEIGKTTLPFETVARMTSPFEFFAGFALPGVTPSRGRLAHPDGSWVRHHGETVEQGGPRRLWDEAERAYEQWLDLGSPTRSRFGLTLTPTSQTCWLDSPSSPHRWPLPGTADQGNRP